VKPRFNRRARVATSLTVLSTLVGTLGFVGSAHADPPITNVSSWGYAYYGYLGNGSTYDRQTPGPVPNERYVTQVSAGPGILTLHADGTVDAWGRNDEGELGTGYTSYRELSPVRAALPPVVQVSAGGNDFGLGLDGSGKTYSFGRNYEGELGRAAGNADPTPRLVSGLPSTIASISAGGSHVLALTLDGHIWAWGWNHNGQLGDPAKHSDVYSTPFQVPALQNIASVSAKGNDSYALDTTGHVWAWGQDYAGQGGAPTQVTGLPTIVSVAAGTNHALGLTADGYVWAWGSNQYGQVGDGGPTGWRSPVQLSGISNVVSVSATDKSSFAVRSDGTAWSWGVNWFGQLGDGTTTQRNMPVQVSGLSNVAGVSSNSFATISWGQLPASPAMVSSVAATVAADSPLYTMRYTVGVSNVTCPASVIVTVGSSLTRSKPVCATGDPSPTSATLNISVLSLLPQTTYAVSATINDAKGTSVVGSGTIVTPKVPVWVADGDSVSSGHHQDQDEPCGVNNFITCLDPANAASYTTSFTPNDSTYAWATRARDQLMTQLSVPGQWRMQILVLSQSGALAQNYNQPGPQNDTTCNGCGEKDATVSALQAHAGSWNIVSATGGANDAHFGDRLKDFYSGTSGQGKPWDVAFRSDCPDLDRLDADIQSTSSLVQTALTQLFGAAQTADPNVRRVAVTYPHVLNSTATCAPDSIGSTPYTGATHAVDDLDTAVTALSTTGVMVVDMRSAGLYSSNPQDDIQLTRYFGYPHPNSCGQDAIAAAVVGRLLS
jgi:alpha-tubulin suppressor-like RCC1 family protein